MIQRSMSNYIPIKAQANSGLTDKQKSLLAFLPETDYNPIKAAELAGYVDPKDALTSVSLCKEIVAIADNMIAIDSVRAAALLRSVLSSNEPILNLKEKIDVAKTLLDRAGVVKKEILNINHHVKGGVFILPTKAQPEGLEVIEGEVVDGEFKEVLTEAPEVPTEPLEAPEKPLETSKASSTYQPPTQGSEALKDSFPDHMETS